MGCCKEHDKRPYERGCQVVYDDSKPLMSIAHPKGFWKKLMKSRLWKEQVMPKPKVRWWWVVCAVFGPTYLMAIVTAALLSPELVAVPPVTFPRNAAHEKFCLTVIQRLGSASGRFISPDAGYRVFTDCMEK